MRVYECVCVCKCWSSPLGKPLSAQDHCDGPNRFQILDFMAAEELQILLGTVVAEGGGDRRIATGGLSESSLPYPKFLVSSFGNDLKES